MFDQWRRSRSQADVVERFIAHDDRTIVRQKVQDVAPIIERATKVRNETGGRTADGGEYLGTIPTTVFYQWMIEWERQGLIAPGNMDAVNGLIVKKLRDSDFSKFRTTDRRL